MPKGLRIEIRRHERNSLLWVVECPTVPECGSVTRMDLVAALADFGELLQHLPVVNLQELGEVHDA